MRKIDFSSHSMNCGRKEFVSKREALKALEKSKTRVTEMIQQARSMQLNSFKQSVGKIIKEDHIVASMPRIRISQAKSLSRSGYGFGQRNFGKNGEQMITGLTSANLSKIAGPDGNLGIGNMNPGIEKPNYTTNQSQDDMNSEDSPGTKPRKVFARAISLNPGEKNSSQLKQL